jgi:hypothetical protein
VCDRCACLPFAVSSALKASSSNNDENKVIRLVHYFLIRLAHVTAGEYLQVRRHVLSLAAHA